MNCTEFEREWAALDDGAGMTASMEAHRSACSRCSELLEDLGVIFKEARALRLSEEPPERVWVALRNQLEMEGLIREPAAKALKPEWKTAPATAWFFRLPMGLAYAAVFLVAVGVMYLQNPPAAPPILVTETPAPLIAPPPQEPEVQALLQKLPEDRRSTFVTNWNQVNSSIENLTNFVNSNPDDPFARDQLMNAFRQRERLRETLARWEEF